MAVHAGRALFEQGIGDRRGNAQRGVLVYVYEAGTSTLATLYTDRTKVTEQDNPLSTNGLGNLAIFADPGDYEAHVDSTGAVLRFTVLPDWEDVVTGDEPEGGLPAHLADPVDAHDASAVSFTPSAGVAATDVQAAIVEVAGDVSADVAGLAAHLGDAVDSHDASAVSFVPAGSLAATTVQAALVELESEKEPTIPPGTYEEPSQLYVASTGDDSRPGNQPGAPLLTLAQAVASAAGAVTTIVITDAVAVPVDITLPSTAHLSCVGAGKLVPAVGVTVTIAGTLQHRYRQIFDISAGGTVTFSTDTRIPDIYPEWWGAAGITESADSTDAIQAAQVAAEAVHGRLVFSRYYNTTAPISMTTWTAWSGPGMPTSPSAAASMPGAGILNDVSDLVTLTTSIRGFTCSDLALVSGINAGGSCIVVPNGTGFNMCAFRNVQMYVQTPGAACLDIDTTTVGGCYGTKWDTCWFRRRVTVGMRPAIDIIANNRFNRNNFVNCIIDDTTSGSDQVFVRMESTTLTQFNSGNTFQFLGERLDGGALHILGGRANTVDIVAYDNVTIVADIVKIDDSGAGGRSRGNTVKLDRRGGTLNGGVYDIKIAGLTEQTVVIGAGSGNTVNHDFGNRPVVLLGDLQAATITGGALSTVLGGVGIDIGGRITEKVTVIAASGAATTVDASLSTVYDVTITAGCTLTLSGAPVSGRATAVTVYWRQGGAGGFAVTHPASVKWAGAAAPVLSTAVGSVDIITYTTVDGGTTWQGALVGKAFA